MVKSVTISSGGVILLNLVAILQFSASFKTQLGFHLMN